MTRWIEKSGTGIEKSGTGIEKSGTGIEGAGTGIEKSGTGIEKSGTGIRRTMLACAISAMAFATASNANASDGTGNVSIAVNEAGQVNVTWMFDNSVFVGFGNLEGSYADVNLLEVTRGFGGTEIAGGGTGVEIAGGGTGIEIAGGGTGSRVLIAGGGTGAEAIAITLPEGTELSMEISMNCGYADVFLHDSTGYEVWSFENVEVKGAVNDCGGNWDMPINYGPGEILQD